jgi:hypothetical protein
VEGGADGAVVDATCSGARAIAAEDLFSGGSPFNSGNDADSSFMGEPMLGDVLPPEKSEASMGAVSGAEFVDNGMNGAMAVGEDVVADTYDSGIKGAIMGTGLGRFVGVASGGGRVDGGTMEVAVGRAIDSVGGDSGIKGAMVGEADGVSLVPSQSSHCTANTQSMVGSKGASPMDALPLPKMNGTVPF